MYRDLLLFSNYYDDVSTEEHQCTSYGFIPGEDVLAQHDGDERGEHYL